MTDRKTRDDPFEDDPEYNIPLQHKRPFGSGLKRKRVVFVPASSGGLNSTGEESTRPGGPSKSVADLYLSLVLPPQDGSSSDRNGRDAVGIAHPPEPAAAAEPAVVCEVCQFPLDEGAGEPKGAGPSPATRPHEASIAHQVCMSHSHPPSALDRSRMGMGVLRSQGWDPDARRGLGASQQGIQFPLKARPKDDTLGIGAEAPRDLSAPADNSRKKKKKGEGQKKARQTYDAKRVRKMVADDRRRTERLRERIFGNSDVEKYLGGGIG